ncbi:6-phospho-beta-glucosidase [Vibrio sp. HA2012]|uniref:family 4 glycosyl hydrolase n=1 Tax=Vibrio sp. HA2012 TaxID=1971595 RepID=UPI000C2BDBB3|nr:6-phospho-beta-glucosidase [Vibrio sp. HA2012]PJC86870.1 6-phospho-beta-glucosidase [Vibrio sp. HA2012]
MDGYLKVVIIGGGSNYTPEVVNEFLRRKDELPIKELWLVDIDEGWEKVNIIAAQAERTLRKSGSEIKLFVTLDRRRALKGADFICSQFRAGCLDGRIRDERVSMKYGLIVRETNGLSGFASACRTIPVMLDICKDIEQLCPEAWLLNFTNPSGMVTEAVLKYTHVKVVGLCHVPAIMEQGINSLLNARPGEALIQFAGLNHFIFTCQVLLNGEDKHDQVLEEIRKGNDKVVPSSIPVPEWPNPALDVRPDELELRGGLYYSESIGELMASIYNDKRTIMHVNTRNNGTIYGLPNECAVEVSSVITKSGPLPLNVTPFPENIQRQIQLMKEYESLTIEAAITGDINLAHRALILNPVVTTDNLLQDALFDTVEENIDYMPQFAHLL